MTTKVKKKKSVKKNTDNTNKKKVKSEVKPKISEKSLKDYSTIIAIVVVVLLVVVAIIGINIDKNNKKKALINEFPYNSFEFIKDQNGHWVTTMNTYQGDRKVPFYYHPSELDNLEYDHRINEMFSIVYERGGKFTVAYGAELANPDIPGTGLPAIAGLEMSKIAAYIFGMETSAGFTGEIEGGNFSLVSCANASSTNYVLEMRLGKENNIYSSKENIFCAIMEVTDLNETVVLADLMAYKITGVINMTKEKKAEKYSTVHRNN